MFQNLFVDRAATANNQDLRGRPLREQYRATGEERSSHGETGRQHPRANNREV